MKHNYGKHILSVLDRFKIHPESWSMNVQKLYNILAKTRPRNVRKITTNTTNLTFYYLLIFLYDTKKTEQFDLPNICSRELCNELITLITLHIYLEQFYY